MSAFPLDAASYEVTPVERAPGTDPVRFVTLLTLLALGILNLAAIGYGVVWTVFLLV